jgi:DNA polymerase-3 subunit beta
MKFIIDRETLLRPLLIVRGVIEQRQTLPVLSNLLITARDGVLVFTATDSEVELEARVAVDDWDGGETTVPARKFIDICQALPGQAKVEFGLDSDNKVHIRSGRSRFTLTTIPASDFPITDEVADGSEFTIAQSDLKRLIDLTQFAMARQDVRYYLNGLLFEVTPQQVKAVATDGHRLAVAQLDAETGVEESKSIIIPRKGVIELARLLTGEDVELKVRVGTNAVRMTIDDVRFSSKLIDGKFPDYGRVVPDVEQCDKRLSMDRESLRQCLVRASVLSSDKHRTVRLTLGSGIMKVAANNPEQETAEDELEIEYAGENLDIGFNVSYLIEALATLPSETADVFLSDASSSCLIQPHGRSSCQFVVMPMRL